MQQFFFYVTHSTGGKRLWSVWFDLIWFDFLSIGRTDFLDWADLVRLTAVWLDVPTRFLILLSYIYVYLYNCDVMVGWMVMYSTYIMIFRLVRYDRRQACSSPRGREWWMIVRAEQGGGKYNSTYVVDWDLIIWLDYYVMAYEYFPSDCAFYIHIKSYDTYLPRQIQSYITFFWSTHPQKRIHLSTSTHLLYLLTYVQHLLIIRLLSPFSSFISQRLSWLLAVDEIQTYPTTNPFSILNNYWGIPSWHFVFRSTVH